MVQLGGKLEGWLPAVCGELLQLHLNGGGASQVLVTRMLELPLRLWAVGTDGEDSSKSLMVKIPFLFLDEMVKVADLPASSSSSNR